MANNDKARTVDMPFSRGVRQDIESRTAPLGSLVSANNLEFDQLNRLVRRDGFEVLGTNITSKTNAITFPVRRSAQSPSGERLLFTDQNTHVYFPDIDKMCEAGLDNQKSTIRATLTETTGVVADETGTIQYADCAAVNGYAVYAYAKIDAAAGPSGAANSGGVYIDVVRVADGTRVITQKQISSTRQYNPNAGQVRCVVSGGDNIIFVLWHNSSGTSDISYVKVTLLTGTITISAVATLISDGSVGGAIFDVDTMASGWILVYSQFTAGTNKARVVTYNNTPTQVNTFTWLDNAGASAWTPSALAVCGDALASATRVHCAGYDPATFKIECVTLTNLLASANYINIDPALSHTKPVTQMALGRRNSTSTSLVFSNYSSIPLTLSAAVTTNPRGHLFCYNVGNGAAGVATIAKDADYANYTLGSKFYRDSRNGTLFALGRFDDPSGFQSHLMLFDFGTTTGGYGMPTPTMHMANGRVPLKTDNLYTGIGGMCDLSAVEAGLFQAIFPINIGTSQISGNQVISYTFQSCGSDRFLSTPCQGEAVVGGATPLSYDGQRLVELSFYSYPVVNVGNLSFSAVGGSIAQGVYQYRLVYEWTDAKGNRHQSPACPAVTADLSGAPYVAGTNQVAIVVPALHATRKQISFPIGGAADTAEPVRVVPYRTKVNSSGPFYRIAQVAVNNTASALDDTVISDFYSDATIAVNEVLYTTAGGRGELFTTAPPPSLQMTTHAQRLWGIDGENPERIWCTKTMSDLTAPGYNPGLQVIIPGAGVINGVAGQDGKLYALATNGVYLASYGDGPDNAGNGAFPSPQLITVDATCEDSRSVLVAGNGIYFVGRDKWGTGIYLIRRGDGNPISIGKRLRTELTNYPVCRGAIDRVDKSRVEFLFTKNDRSDTIANVSIIAYYHYDLLDDEGIGQWTVATPNDGSVAEMESLGIWTEPISQSGTTVGLDKMVSVLANTSNSVGAQRAGIIRDLGGAVPSVLLETADIRPFGLIGYGRLQGVSMYGTGVSTDPIRMEVSFDSGATWATHSFGSVSSTANPLIIRWETTVQKLPDGGMVRIRIGDEILDEIQPGTTYFHGLTFEVEPLGGNARLGGGNRA